jgi:hypothetical protein
VSHRSELDKDAVRNIVTAAGVGEQLVEKIAMLVAVPEMMVWIDDLERRFQNFFFALRPPSGITVARSGRRISRGGRNWRGVALGVCRGSLKPCPTQHPRRCDQHRAARYRTPANRLLSHQFRSRVFCSNHLSLRLAATTLQQHHQTGIGLALARYAPVPDGITLDLCARRSRTSPGRSSWSGSIRRCRPQWLPKRRHARECNAAPRLDVWPRSADRYCAGGARGT